MTVIDFAAGPPPAAAIKAAGHTGVMLYISDAREPWMTGKNPSREYLDSLDREGIKFGFVYQFRKGGSMSAGDAGRGFAGGAEDAAIALRRLNELRCSEHPVFFAVDWDVSLHEWNTRVADYFRGAASKLGKERVGIYGHSRVVDWAREDDLVAEVAPGRVLGWVTRSWGSLNADGSPRGRDYAVLFQGVHNVPGPGGVPIDINEVFHGEWGWRKVADRRVNRPPIPGFTLHPVEWPCDLTIDTPDSGWRDPKLTQCSVIHTTENGDATPPENVANWQRNPANQSSYNTLIGADATGAKSIRTNPDNRRSWSAGEPGNTNAVHMSNIGYAARTRAQWLANPKQLEKNAEWCADQHLRYDRPLVWLNDRQVARGDKGFCSHGTWFRGRGGPAYRSDPGDGYPHDIVLARAREIAEGTGGITVAEADRIIQFIIDYLGPNNSDTKDNREQLTGGRDRIPGNLKASYPGWDLDRLVKSAREKKFRGLTLVEMCALAVGASDDDKAAARAAAAPKEK